MRLKLSFLACCHFLGLDTQREHLKDNARVKRLTIKEISGSSHIFIGAADLLFHPRALHGQAILRTGRWREERRGEGEKERETGEGDRDTEGPTVQQTEQAQADCYQATPLDAEGRVVNTSLCSP